MILNIEILIRDKLLGGKVLWTDDEGVPDAVRLTTVMRAQGGLNTPTGGCIFWDNSKTDFVSIEPEKTEDHEDTEGEKLFSRIEGGTVIVWCLNCYSDVLTVPTEEKEVYGGLCSRCATEAVGVPMVCQECKTVFLADPDVIHCPGCGAHEEVEMIPPDENV